MNSRYKKVFVGVDEAGYGPNLGPLLIAGSVWRAPVNVTESALCARLSEVLRPAVWRPDCQHVPLGDSKKLYQSGGGLRTLEFGLLAMLRNLPPVESVADVAQPMGHLGLLMDRHARFNGQQVAAKLPPWYAELNSRPVPQAGLADGSDLDAFERELARLSELAASTLAECELELLEVRAVVVSEPWFNAQVDELGSKGLLLSRVSLKLVSELLSDYPMAAEVFCDRQGGRKNYLPLLADAFPDAWFQEVAISNARCSYRNQGSQRMDVHFSVGGDRFPPTALASMLAKYLRERLMESFNAFWQQHVPGIKPTAGYPVDAQRYRTMIEPKALELAMPASFWWRQK